MHATRLLKDSSVLKNHPSNETGGWNEFQPPTYTNGLDAPVSRSIFGIFKIEQCFSGFDKKLILSIGHAV